MDILLATINAKYIHASFGLRCLRANLRELRERSALVEFTLGQRPIDMVETMLASQPRIIGLGVYIWNAVESLEVVRLLKAIAPHVKVVIGGPEVSHELESQALVDLADYVITGEGEVAFYELCARLLTGRGQLTKVLAGGLPDLASLVLPYDEYTDEDVAHRVLYVEASRGCPFTCEFCLSSLDTKVRSFPLEALLAAFAKLVARGATQFKFVDRTFNLSPKTSAALLDFFLARPTVFAHFEMVPDRFPEALRERLSRFAPGMVQLEVGIQTLDDATAARISRRLDVPTTFANLQWLHAHTGTHVHADLIVGLPGEDTASFARGFDQLVLAGPHEIQVGILKRLKGTPITRHDEEWQVVWSPTPPYEILANRLISFSEMQALKRFARVWDLVANRGNFVKTLPLLWQDTTPFAGIMEFTAFLAARASLGAVSLGKLADAVYGFLQAARGMEAAAAAAAMAVDFIHTGASVPKFLQAEVIAQQRAQRAPGSNAPARQAKHQRA